MNNYNDRIYDCYYRNQLDETVPITPEMIEKLKKFKLAVPPPFLKPIQYVSTEQGEDGIKNWLESL